MKRRGRQTIGNRSRREAVAQKSGQAMTLNEYFEEWIARQRATTDKQATPYRYNQCYRNHLRQPLGEKKLGEIGVRDVRALQSDTTDNAMGRTGDALFFIAVERNAKPEVLTRHYKFLQNPTQSYKFLHNTTTSYTILQNPTQP